MISERWFYDGKHPNPIAVGEFVILALTALGVPVAFSVDFPIAYVTNIGPGGVQRYLDVYGAYQAGAITLPYVFHATSPANYPAGTMLTGSSLTYGGFYNHAYGAGTIIGVIATFTINADGTYSVVPP